MTVKLTPKYLEAGEISFIRLSGPQIEIGSEKLQFKKLKGDRNNNAFQ
jgi:hypothetical protein